MYKKTIGVNTHLYKGTEYTDYNHRITGNPFFGSTYFGDGSVVYDGIFYDHVQMFYDILHDDIVIRNYNDTPLVLVKEKVSSFNYNGHHFINLGADSNLNNFKISGFYDVLYDGNTKFLARRKKELVEKITTTFSESYFTEKTEYYILKNNELSSVSDKRSVLAVLKDHKNEMNKYMHQSKFKFRKDFENATSEVLAYYDRLNTAK